MIMAYGIDINDIKYICLYNNNELKKISIEDNVYFTLRDIFLNADTCDISLECNYFNSKLTNGICFEDRDNTFKYTNILNNKHYLTQLINFLNNIDKHWFDFDKKDCENFIIDKGEYIKFNDWWIQFEELKKTLLEKKSNL